MLTDSALANFDAVWTLFREGWPTWGGELFEVQPLRPYLSRHFAESLTDETARTRLYTGFARWGAVEQEEHERAPAQRIEVEGGKPLWLSPGFKDPRVTEVRGFLIASILNLCSVAVHKTTLEQLIHRAYSEISSVDSTEEALLAYCRLIGMSKAFLLAEWSSDLIHKAVCNDDTVFFKQLKVWLTRDTPAQRFPSNRQWVAVTLLWHLGGKELSREELLGILRERALIAPEMGIRSFNVMLRRLPFVRSD